MSAVPGSQAAEPHCDAASQDTFNHTPIKVNQALGAQAKFLQAPKKIQPLLCLLKDDLGVEGPCECVCDL